MAASQVDAENTRRSRHKPAATDPGCDSAKGSTLGNHAHRPQISSSPIRPCFSAFDGHEPRLVLGLDYLSISGPARPAQGLSRPGHVGFTSGMSVQMKPPGTHIRTDLISRNRTHRETKSPPPSGRRRLRSTPNPQRFPAPAGHSAIVLAGAPCYAVPTQSSDDAQPMLCRRVRAPGTQGRVLVVDSPVTHAAEFEAQDLKR